MTVQELINDLQQYDPNAPVNISHEGDDWTLNESTKEYRIYPVDPYPTFTLKLEQRP